MSDLRIEATLTKNEQTILTLMLGMATGMIIHEMNPALAPDCVRIVNKLLALDPDYEPYDENSFEPGKKPFPFRMMPKQ